MAVDRVRVGEHGRERQQEEKHRPKRPHPPTRPKAIVSDTDVYRGEDGTRTSQLVSWQRVVL